MIRIVLRFERRRGSWVAFLGAASLLLNVLLQHRAAADPARFWISTTTSAPTSPEAPSIPGVQNATRVLNIWAQPATLNPGPFDAGNNPFKMLRNFSLDVVANPDVVSFLSNSVVVYNPVVNGNRRFQLVHDSTVESTSPIKTQGPFFNEITSIFTPYHMDAIQGFTINGPETGFGGAACSPGDPYCAQTANGSPAWLVASLAAKAITDAGSSDYFLQIGADGMNHATEASSVTFVKFGTDGNPEYNASTNRQATNGDAAHFVLQAQPVSAAIETRWTTGNGEWSQLAGGSAPSFLNNVIVDGGLVTVSGSQQANSTTVNGGRLHINAGASLASDVTVANGGAISGSGSVASGLILQGTFAANSTAPLRVGGITTISGGSLGIVPDYSGPLGLSNPMVVLESAAGLVGTFNTVIGQQIGPDATLASIVHGPHTVTIQVNYTPGDFNKNNLVDGADYVVWRKGLGTTFSAADYERWRSNFGSSYSAGVGVSNAAVPEPTVGVAVIAPAFLMFGRVKRCRSKRVK